MTKEYLERIKAQIDDWKMLECSLYPDICPILEELVAEVETLQVAIEILTSTPHPPVDRKRIQPPMPRKQARLADRQWGITGGRK